MSEPFLSIGLIARDKFSGAATALAAAVADLPPNSEVVVLDAGYPAALADRLRELGGDRIRWQATDGTPTPIWCGTSSSRRAARGT